MNSFSTYIEPLLSWLQVHPHWALFFTFIISFAESLAIVGSIIPGSLTMTAIGILAGSGVMRVDLTLIAATMGAIAGDSSSYLIGYTFSDRLVNFWPFSRYPNLLSYGKEYFGKHGGKSVLVGRFVGPLRSIIPVIAGMMRMSQWRFFLANFFSAIAWAFLYVLPGVLIGAASSELSPESAARLFVVVLFFIGVIWLLSVIIKWLLIRINLVLKVNLHDFWSWSGRHPYLANLFKKLTPENETCYYQTAGLVLAFILCLIFFLLLLLYVITCTPSSLNLSIHLFLQSLRTAPLDATFICLLSITNSINIIVLAMIIFIIAWLKQNKRQAIYWLSLNLSTSALLLLLSLIITSPLPEGLLFTKPGNSFPAWELSFATVQYITLVFYAHYIGKSTITRIFTSFAVILLIINGFASVYLGDYWVTDVLAAYFLGLVMSISHWLFYRRHNHDKEYGSGFISVIVLTLIVSTISSIGFFFDQEMKNHQPYNAQYVFTDDAWWLQKKPILPIYRTNRIGRPTAFFNLQYAGSLNHLETELSQHGWHKDNDSLFYLLLKRMNKNSTATMPLMAQLYLNRKPVLIMTYKPLNDRPMQILRVWRSNYHLKDFKQPIWLGSIETHLPSKVTGHNHGQSTLGNSSVDYLSSALGKFPQRRISFRNLKRQHFKIVNAPILLIIKEIPDRLPTADR